MAELILGDCLEKMRQIKSESIDSLVTDPPAGIGFMGKNWDSDKGGRDHWIKWMSDVMRECHRVLKPGAHGLVWSLPRTSHWTATACEDAGFEIRDVITALFGSGFPKSMSLEKAFDKKNLICDCLGNENIKTQTDLSEMRNHVSTEKQNSTKQSETLQFEMRRCNKALESKICCSPTGDCTQRPCRMDENESQILSKENDRSQQSGMGGWEISGAEKGLHHDSKSETSQSTSQRICMRTHSSDGTDSGSEAQKGRRDSSYQSSTGRQSTGEFETIQNASRTLVGTPCERLRCSQCNKIKRKEVKGYGTALKPAAEFWHLIRKPLSEKTVAQNVLKWGTGAINVDGCRIGTEKRHPGNYIDKKENKNETKWGHKSSDRSEFNSNQGRFPANLVLSHSPHCTDTQCDLECAIALLDEQSGNLGRSSGGGMKDLSKSALFQGRATKNKTQSCGFGDSGGASRFFYCAKTSTSERNAGLEGMPDKQGGIKNTSGRGFSESDPHKEILVKNNHPTVKPQKLMRYFCRLITPPNGIILDPFMGSGSTGLAAKSEGFKFIGIEQNEEYFEIAKKRIK